MKWEIANIHIKIQIHRHFTKTVHMAKEQIRRIVITDSNNNGEILEITIMEV